jgi:outer membrane protein, heavy metal efflux system
MPFPDHSCRLAAAWLGCLLATCAQAQPAGGLSFERALLVAAERAPMLAARQAAVDAAAQLRTGAAELPDPRLTVGVDNLPVGGPDRFTIGRDTMTQRTVGWMQDVPNRAKRAARAEGAEARTEREQALLAAERVAVQRDVAQAWLARWFAERQLVQFAALEAENRLLRDTVTARVAGGRAMPAEATMARQDSLMLADRRDELERERLRTQATLLRWLGADAAQPLAGPPPPLAVDTARLHAAIEQHADLRAFEPLLRMTRAELQEAQAARQGDWNWQVGYAKRGSGYGDMVSFQFSFELPLWAGTRQEPQITARLKDAERIAAEREDLLRRRREEIDLQLADLAELGSKQARLQQAALPLADERVALALAAYEAARGDLAAVLAARRERAELALRDTDLQARQHLLRARLHYLVAEVR